MTAYEGWPEPRVVARDLRFPEGPVYLGGGALAVVEIRGGRLARIEDGATKVLAELGGGPNGAALDTSGDIWVANNGGLSLGPDGYWFAEQFVDGSIQRVGPVGSSTDALSPIPGEDPHRPNDICIGPDGKIYFTDPRNWEDFEHFKVGRLWRFDPATGAADSIADIPNFCNGLAFGADPSRLYVAQSNVMKIFEYDWTETHVGEPRDWATLPAGFPDGFCFAANGDCYVCGSMGHVMQVFDAEGTLKQTIEFPDHSEPTNCCFGDGELYVTCSGTGELLAFDLGVEGLALFPFRS
jgi:gluconolactonase